MMPADTDGSAMNYWINRYREAARRAARRRQEREQREQRQRLQALMVASVMLFGLLVALVCGLAITRESTLTTQRLVHVSGQSAISFADFTDMTALAERTGSSCEARYDWPVGKPHVEQNFDRPLNQWSAGHRGVDLAAEPGTVLLAPQDGVVSFVGEVAGKNVLSVRHRDGITSTFEPATTDLRAGDAVSRGQPIGTVGGVSDHCDEQCVHWGLKRGAHDYLDPQSYAGNRIIVLKPT